MEEEIPPSPVFKKRPPKGAKRSSTSSLRDSTVALAQEPSTPLKQDAGDDEDGNVVVIRSSAKGKKTPLGRVKHATGAKSRLSFGAAGTTELEADDEDSEVSAVKSSSVNSPASTSRRLLRPTSTPTTSLPSHLDQATISPQPSTSSMYSKQHLDELKAGTMNAPKPATTTTTTTTTHDELTRSKFGDQIQDDFDTIPTSAAIAEAKKRREQARAAGVDHVSDGNNGFISLEVGFAAKGGDSRLVREEDEIGDGDEDVAAYTGADEKVPLGSKANKEAARKMREGIIDMIQDAEEDEQDAEAREWEEAQIKRGEQRRSDARPPKTARKPYAPAPIPQSSTLPSLAGVSSRLSNALSVLTSSHTLDSAALDHFARERAELDAQENELRAEVIKVEEKHRWFSDFKNFMEDVAAFLGEKYPALEQIERENLAIQKERYEIVAKRRFADDADDVALFTGESVPSIFSFNSAANSEDQPIEPMAHGTSAPGSDFPEARSARRAARGRRVESLRQQAGSVAPEQDDLGTWTDDELPSDTAADLADAVHALRTNLARLFEDVKADDFRDPNLGIRKRFEQWRGRYTEDYTNAFGGLALVGVWEFWARVEMAMWNPFEISQLAKSPPGLDSYSWHASLTSYGHVARASSVVSDEDGQEEDASEAEEVVNALVTSVVIPRLDKLARESFDPMSRWQTARAVTLVDEISYCVERSSPKFESLVQAFVSRFQLAITQAQSLIGPHLAVIAQPARAFDPSAFSARLNFLQRQVKLLENSNKWRRHARSVRASVLQHDAELAGAGLLFDQIVQRELVAKVILPVVEASWSTGGQSIAVKVLSLLPGEVPPALVRRLQGEE